MMSMLVGQDMENVYAMELGELERRRFKMIEYEGYHNPHSMTLFLSIVEAVQHHGHEAVPDQSGDNSWDMSNFT